MTISWLVEFQLNLENLSSFSNCEACLSGLCPFQLSKFTQSFWFFTVPLSALVSIFPGTSQTIIWKDQFHTTSAPALRWTNCRISDFCSSSSTLISIFLCQTLTELLTVFHPFLVMLIVITWVDQFHRVSGILKVWLICKFRCWILKWCASCLNLTFCAYSWKYFFITGISHQIISKEAYLLSWDMLSIWIHCMFLNNLCCSLVRNCPI